MKRAAANVLILVLAVGSGSSAAGGLVSTDRGRNDCWAAFDVEGGRAHCRDGDPSCDADGMADGVCTFAVRVCVHVKNVPDCRPRRITQVVVRASGYGQPYPVSIPLPPLPVRRETCGEVGFVRVALRVRSHRRLKPGKRRLLLRATTQQGLSDTDHLQLYCLANAIPCLANPAGGSRAVRMTVGDPGSDFDLGTSGATHNARLPYGWKLDLCLLGCDADTNPVCQASGVGGGFAPPLPIVAGGVPLCLVTGVESVGGLRGTADVRSGAIDLAGNLATDVYVTDETHVCPRCLARGPELMPTCDSGAFAGGACIVDGIAMVGDTAYAVSRGCMPSEEQLAGSIAVPVALTTGSSTLAAPCPPVGTPVTPPACDDCTEGICAGDACASRSADGTCVDVKGGVSQACCASEPTRPCFPSDVVERVGATVIPAPAWPDPAYPKSASGAALAATFCAPASGSSIDGASGLPGPGALLVPVTEGWVR